jgi:hypothetical protein
MLDGRRDKRFAVRARDERTGTDFKVNCPKSPLARDVGNGLALPAAFDIVREDRRNRTQLRIKDQSVATDAQRGGH